MITNGEMFDCSSIRSAFNSIDHIPDLIHWSSIINRRNKLFPRNPFLLFYSPPRLGSVNSERRKF